MIIHMVFLSACVKLLRQLFSWRLRALFQSRRPTLRGERAETGNPLAHHAEIHDRRPVPNGPTTVSVTWLLPKAPRESVMPRVFCQMLISVISIRYTVFPSKNKVILWYYLYFSKYIPLCRRIPTLESRSLLLLYSSGLGSHCWTPGQEPGPAQSLMDPSVSELCWRDLWCIIVLFMHPPDHMMAIPEGLFLHPSNARLTNWSRLLCCLADSSYLFNSPTLCFLSSSFQWSLYSHGPIECVPFPFNY